MHHQRTGGELFEFVGVVLEVLAYGFVSGGDLFGHSTQHTGAEERRCKRLLQSQIQKLKAYRIPVDRSTSETKRHVREPHSRLFPEDKCEISVVLKDTPDKQVPIRIVELLCTQSLTD